MKYLKLFEELNNEDNASQIKEIWEIDPYELNDIILSSCSEVSIWGEVRMNFLILIGLGDGELEYTDVEFKMKNGELEIGENYDTMKETMKENSYITAIEVFIGFHNFHEFEKRDEFVEIIEDMLLGFKSKYHLSWDEDKEGEIYLYFNKTKENYEIH